MTQVYCAATIKSKWTEVQATIRRIDQSLLEWRKCLPSEFSIDFDMWDEQDWQDKHVLARMGLAMQFCSSRIILFRPCLCRFEGRSKEQSERSKDFNQEAVELCVRSAREMISLLSPIAGNVQNLYAVTPWWNALHHICEALSVLMLEMAFRSQHVPQETAFILEDAKKGVRWLSMMAEQSVSARKAWEIFDRLIRLVAPRINWSVYDLPTDAPVPLGYNLHRFSHLSGTNLNEYQPQPMQVASSNWQEQPPDFGYGQGYGTNFGQPTAADVAANPLDHTAAIQRFESISQLHGHYDDPWQHMFQYSRGHEQQLHQPLPEQMGLADSTAQAHRQAPYRPHYNHFNPMHNLQAGYVSQTHFVIGSGNQSQSHMSTQQNIQGQRQGPGPGQVQGSFQGMERRRFGE